jgi:hypothetical protein
MEHSLSTDNQEVEVFSKPGRDTPSRGASMQKEEATRGPTQQLTESN